MKKYFKFFSNCILTKGALYSTISDLQRGRVQYIPSELFDFFDDTRKVAFPNDDEVINEYLNYFIDKEFGFLHDNVEDDFFPKLSLDFEMPKVVYNVVVDFNQKSHSIERLVKIIEEITPSWLSLRFFNKYSLEQYINIFDEMDKMSYPISLDLCIPYTKELDYFLLENLTNKYFNISQVLQHSCPHPKESLDVQGTQVSYTSMEISSEKCCGVINKEGFAVNLTAFSEAVNFNSCLNGKVSIDVEGNIKNCPSMNESYGNISKTSLIQVLNGKNFDKYWGLNKDKIHVCQDCEFRYICTDCRAYIEDPKDILSKPLKCGYNPYTGEWSEWSLNPLKQKAISFYELTN